MIDKYSQKNLQSRMTPIDVNYATCDYTYVVLIIYGDFFEIKNKIDVIPSFQQTKGEVFTNSLGIQRVAPCSLWTLNSENIIQSKDSREHIDYILSIVYPYKDFFIELQNSHKMYMKCVWFSEDAVGSGPALWPEQMKILSELNLELSFSFYPKEW